MLNGTKTLSAGRTRHLRRSGLQPGDRPTEHLAAIVGDRPPPGRCRFVRFSRCRCEGGRSGDDRGGSSRSRTGGRFRHCRGNPANRGRGRPSCERAAESARAAHQAEQTGGDHQPNGSGCKPHCQTVSGQISHLTQEQSDGRLPALDDAAARPVSIARPRRPADTSVHKTVPGIPHWRSARARLR